jgi:hypothetical protein
MPSVTEQIIHERAIRRCLLDYCSAIDACDIKLLKSVYHDDSFDDHGTFQGTGHEFADVVVPLLSKRYRGTQHTIGGTTFDWVSDTVVSTETNVAAQHVGVDDEGTYLEWFAGVYTDRFEQRDDVWRIADRRLTHTWDKVERIQEYFPPGAFTPRRRLT